MKAIVNAKIITDTEVLEGYNLLFSKKIIKITKELPIWAKVIDAEGLYLSAGFIDIHIHGSNGFDVMDASFEALEEISKSIVQTGTTSFLATTMTMQEDEILNALANIQTYKKLVTGAKVLGTHLEGPFINLEKHGAQNPEFIQKPNFEFIEPFMDSINMITLAPEVKGAKEFIEYLSKHYPHVLLSIGHSDASYEQSKESFKWGISHATHLFNAMNPLHHREPGIVGAILESDASFDVIADLIHIHPSFFNMLYKLKKEELILITDAMRAGCIQCAVSEIGGQKVVLKDGEARLEDGTLAGSILTLNKALKNFYEHSDISLPELLATVTSIPADKLGLKLGKLEEDYPVDIVLFNEKFDIKFVFIDGFKLNL
jgi:N-acetylglucosamine-6-phosphate deacetylase